MHKSTSKTPIPEPFLREVARTFVNNTDSDELDSLCFVTPNKRSGIFLAKHLEETMREAELSGFAPATMPISDFIAEFTQDVEASRIEQLMILYRVYSNVLKRHSANEAEAVDFNRFQYWGDMLLNDFNDVDRYLVDAQMLFKNVSDLKEISSNFLTPEQIEVIKQYWNESLVPEPVKEFWEHVVHSSDVIEIEGDDNSSDGRKNVASFLKLWQVMFEIYTDFRAELGKSGLTYSGKTYRDALETIKDMEANEFEYNRYIFVGFNVLSTSEHDIFKAMQRLGIADFYWDYASPSFKVASNHASTFMKNNLKEFPSFYKGVGTATLQYYPDVKVIGVPSTIGQAKLIPSILKELHPKFFNPDFGQGLEDEKLKAEYAELVDTAIVMPDENLVQPILTAMPEEIRWVNVTMGFSLRHTGVASLIGKIVSLQLRARELSADNTFFYDDVIGVLSHPLMRLIDGELCNSIITFVNKSRLFNIPVSILNEERFNGFSPIFTVVSNANDPEAVMNYLRRLLGWLLQSLYSVTETAPAESDAEENKGGVPILDVQYVKAYLEALDELNLLRDKYLKSVYLEDKTIFHLVERVVGNQTVSYDGVPLAGLQTMGVLESRSLDFRNLIMPSMNERIFPRKHYAKTFIPNALRKGYGMATVEHQECMYAYYFYRLISRAETVYLLYDGRTTGVRSGGPSRFINQIKYQFPKERFHLFTSAYKFHPIDIPPLQVKKDERVMEKLNLFRKPDSRKNLSASSLNAYINCPLQFYLTSVEGYYEEKDVLDYMDDSTYGTIIHDVVQRLYDDEKALSGQAEIPVNSDLLDKLSNIDHIKRYVGRAIRSIYLNIPADDPAPLHGDAAIYHEVMSMTIAKMFERERELTDQTFYLNGEVPSYVHLRVSDKNSVNVSYRIDRVDRFIHNGQSHIRLVDYKTGGDDITAQSMESLFVEPKGFGFRPKAMLQLLLYANAYAQNEKNDGPIQPFIYQFRKLAVQTLQPLKIGGQEIMDYRAVNDEFLSRLDALLDEMFDPAIPFVAKPSQHSCKFCKFVEICQAAKQK